MKKLIYLITLFYTAPLFAVATIAHDDSIYGTNMIENIPAYSNYGGIFTYLQSEWFSVGFLIALLLVPIAGGIHYFIIGPKVFSHDGKKIYAFNLFVRIVHLLAAISFIVLVPTGFIMAFGDTFGGGVFVRTCKNLHGLATIIFCISVFPILFAWFIRMLPGRGDMKWMLSVGGYLSKEKKPVTAGKFNAGQKAWFWIAMLGGIIMILTGAMMFFQNDALIAKFAESLGLYPIDLLRLSAIVHNILGMIIAIFFMVHIYMSAIAIKGAIYSMVTGYKEEEEVKILHSYWYKELQEEGKI